MQCLMYRLSRFDTQKDMKWIRSAEALLGVFVNLLHESIPQIVQIFTNQNLV